MPQPAIIAVVDDDVSFREALAGLVQAFGYSVAAYGSGQALLQSDRLAAVECVIADVQMPGMDGLELLGRLAEAGRPAPVILVTSFASATIAARAARAGAIAVLAKPFDREELWRHLLATVGRPVEDR